MDCPTTDSAAGDESSLSSFDKTVEAANLAGVQQISSVTTSLVAISLPSKVQAALASWVTRGTGSVWLEICTTCADHRRVIECLEHVFDTTHVE